MTELFREQITADQKEAIFECEKHTKLTKILTQHCVNFGNKYQKDRNKVMHDEQKQKG